jgi:hypothetical protein
MKNPEGGKASRLCEFFEMAVADVSARFVTFPYKGGVLGAFIFFGGVHKGCIPTPGIRSRQPNAAARARNMVAS